MKQCVIIAFLLMATIAVSGQTIKGTKALGGGISYSKTTLPDVDGEDEGASEFSFTPSVGYFVGDKILVGIDLEYTQSKISAYPYGEAEQSGFAFGPFARYYVHTSNEQFAFFGQASVMFGSTKRSFELSDDEEKGKAIDINIAPGFAYFFNEHWALEIGFRGIGFTNTDPNKDVDDDEIKSMQIGLSSLSPSTIGIRYHF